MADYRTTMCRVDLLDTCIHILAKQVWMQSFTASLILAIFMYKTTNRK